jgi:hypothetical protein
MQYTNVHLFESLEAANAAIQTINQGEGIPVSDDAVTLTYTQAQENNSTIYIVADDVTEKYLGEPTKIEIYDNLDSDINSATI